MGIHDTIVTSIPTILADNYVELILFGHYCYALYTCGEGFQTNQPIFTIILALSIASNLPLTIRDRRRAGRLFQADHLYQMTALDRYSS